jgi:hypothetical protein
VSAGGALQSAIAGSLDAIGELTGVFDGPPARAPFPYAAIDAATELDWSPKSGEGREVMIGITVWDDQPVRLHQLADAVEAQMRSIENLAGWQLVSLRLMRRRIVRDVAGPWAAAIDFRARMLAAN